MVLRRAKTGQHADRRVGGGGASGISWVTDWPGRCTMNASDTTWAPRATLRQYE